MRGIGSVKLREASEQNPTFQRNGSQTNPPRPFLHEDDRYVAELAAKAMRLKSRPGKGFLRGLPPIVDFIIAALALLLTAPLMFIIALLIRLDSPGPVIFRQVRIGQDRRREYPQTDGGQQRERTARYGNERREKDILGQPFTLYKFRTMRHDGREVYPHLYDFDLKEEEVSNLHLAMPEDPRVTRIGHFLRCTSLDELPNFFNILKGDMALVGPRPELPDVAKYYKDWQKLKFKVKPGLTGKAQVSGRGFLSFEETIIYDVEYVLERSVRTDLRLLWQTVSAVVRGIGAF